MYRKRQRRSLSEAIIKTNWEERPLDCTIQVFGWIAKIPRKGFLAAVLIPFPWIVKISSTGYPNYQCASFLLLSLESTTSQSKNMPRCVQNLFAEPILMPKPNAMQNWSSCHYLAPRVPPKYSGSTNLLQTLLCHFFISYHECPVCIF